jgi:hypothetical protein
MSNPVPPQQDFDVIEALQALHPLPVGRVVRMLD